MDAVALGIVAAIIGQIVTLITLVYNSKQQRLREERNHRWEVEDRAALATKVVQTSDALAAKVLQTSDALASTVVQTTAGIQAAIADNTIKTEQATTAAHEAFKEANNVNNKISDLNNRLLDQERKS